MPETLHCAETRTPLDPLVPPVPQGRVLVAGGANMDVIAAAQAAPLAGDSTPGAITCMPGGVGRNIAENLARLGLTTALFSAVGDDAFGRTVLQACVACGVDIRPCLVLPEQRTATYLAVHGPSGELVSAVNDMGILAQLGPAHLEPLAQTIAASACLVVDCNLEPQVIAWLLAQSGGAAVFVDAVSVAKCQKLRARLDRIHTLKVNALEAQALTGLSVTTVAQAEAAALRLCSMGVRRAVVSLGRTGAVWAEEGQTGACASRPVAVTNTTGAGDAMLAGLVFAHLSQWPTRRALPWAMACAELTLASASANRSDLSVALVEERLASTHRFPAN